MTRKHYVILAQAIQQANRDCMMSDKGKTLMSPAVMQTALRISMALEQDNSRFDRERFMEACGF